MPGWHPNPEAAPVIAPALVRRLLAELVDTALLVAVVVGSGIAAQKLSPNQTGLQLLENSTTTVFGLGVLIALFGPVSGAHFNPVVATAGLIAAIFALARTGRASLSAVTVASYIGIDLSREFPQPLTDNAVRATDVVITMGCGDACPIYPGKRTSTGTCPTPPAMSYAVRLSLV